MALRLDDVERDTIANRALNQLMDDYTVAEEKSRLVLTKKSGDIKLFLYELYDLHQLHFVRNQQMVREIERLRVLSTSLDQQRETWKLRALVAEAQLLEATSNSNNNGGSQKVSDRSGVAGSLGALSSPWPCVSSSRRGAPCSLGAWSSRRPCVSGSRGAPQARSAP